MTAFNLLMGVAVQVCTSSSMMEASLSLVVRRLTLRWTSYEETIFKGKKLKYIRVLTHYISISLYSPAYVIGQRLQLCSAYLTWFSRQSSQLSSGKVESSYSNISDDSSNLVHWPQAQGRLGHKYSGKAVYCFTNMALFPLLPLSPWPLWGSSHTHTHTHISSFFQ